MPNLPPTRPKYPTKEFLIDLWHFLKNYKLEFLIFSIILTIAFLFELIPPLILSKIIDLLGSESRSLSKFYFYIIILFTTGIFGTIIRVGSKHYLSITTNKIQRLAKVESFEKIMQGDLIWHDKENTGRKMQKIIEGEKALGYLMDFYINRGINMIITTLGILGIFAFFSLKYTLITIVYMIIYLIFEFGFNKKVAQKTLETKIAAEIASGKAFEFSSNIQTIKSLGLECSSNKQISCQEEKVLKAKIEKRIASSYKWLIINLVSTIFYSLFVYLVGMDIFTGVLTVGIIIVYIDYIRRMGNILSLVSGESLSLIDSKFSIYRMMEIYKTIPEYDEPGSKDLKDWKEITIKNIEFNYKKEGVLEDINFKIKKGEKIGVVGKSGCGKSTLFKLLLKLYLPKSGMIYFDKKPINQITKKSIIDKISVVPQETELFNLSLKENITISKNKLDYNQYKKAVAISQITAVIAKLKEKDQTLIGEKGVRLSGGERQRLGIARAIYKDSEIIIFDESTSNLDYETERKILHAMKNELKDKTLIISAHRLSTLMEMDKILYFEKGRIIEEGSYDELIRKKGKFYSLLKEQSREKILTPNKP